MADDVPGFPFGGMPFFGDLAKALAGQGPLNWDAARQFAVLASTGGAAEANVEPSVRIAYEALARIAEMHVTDLTGLSAPPPRLELTTPGVWAQRTLEDYRPLFTELAASLGRPPTGPSADPSDDPSGGFAAMLGALSQMMAPAMLGMALGSMVGRLATRAFGQYDLPIPRRADHLLVLPSAVDAFAAEWSLPVDEMRMWVLAQELTGHMVYAQAPVRDAITSLVRRHVAAFRPDADAVAEALSAFDIDGGDPMESLQQMFGDPTVMLGAVRSPEQIDLAPVLDAATAAVVGFVDYVVDAVAVRVVGGDALRIAEAVRRRRVEATSEDVFVERLLGLHVTAPLVQRGKDFVAGVVDRAGETVLHRLFTTVGGLPTPAELDAPGLWLARLELGDG